MINELSEQRAKLENYTKKTLHAVQTKYMVAVSSHRNQINERQERVDFLEKKMKEVRASYSREQALMMSSFYEVKSSPGISGCRLLSMVTMLSCTDWNRDATSHNDATGPGCWCSRRRLMACKQKDRRTCQKTTRSVSRARSTLPSLNDAFNFARKW